MKRKTIYNILAVLFAVSVFSVSCTKKNSEVRLAPKLSTSQVLSVSSDSATVIGFVIAQGNGFTEKGACYDTATNPTVNNNKVLYTGDNSKATYKVVLSGLHYATKYYVRAFAITTNGAIYGKEYSFTTLPVVPTVTTDTISSITGNSASGGGNVTNNGGAAVTVRGVCYGTNHNPTISDTKTTNGKGTGAFVSSLTNLKGNTTYYVRAYASNSAGTGYGPEVSFKTPVDLPQVTTAAVTSVTKTSAVSGGTLTYNGGGTISERGIVWGLNADPTVSDNKIVGAADTTYTDTISGLAMNTTYHVRAYAVNSAGIAYGADISFTTLANTRTWYLPGDYVEASYPGSGYANWSPGNCPVVKSTVTNSDNLEGYVYMANASNQWKFTDGPAWTINYGSTDGSNLVANGSNITSPKGYYKINVDAAAMTYTAVATVWGVIGDATPGGWNTDTPLVYNDTTQTWGGGVHMVSGSFKFRANNAWTYNYGSNNDDGTLQAGGSNIPVTTDGDYYVTLNLSHPNTYTYSANHWAIIGDATPGGWGSDTFMTWDATDQCMTVTVDLTAAQFKFRANSDWNINLGGDIKDLTVGGANISITTAGNYTIKLYLGGTPHCTITKN